MLYPAVFAPGLQGLAEMSVLRLGAVGMSEGRRSKHPGILEDSVWVWYDGEPQRSLPVNV
jgi:hypothetical protein